MHTYIAFLRGINVGGNSLIKMADLQTSLAESGLQNVRTYIQSGNVIFQSDITDSQTLANQITQVIKRSFNLDVAVAVFEKTEWRKVITAAPSWWGVDKTWKHNILIMIPPYDMKETVAAIGELKPDIEAIEPGTAVLYQSISLDKFGRTTSGKLASSPVYKKMTIRNYNTAVKLANLLTES